MDSFIKKYNLQFIPLIILSVILYKLVGNPKIIKEGFDYIVSILSYIIWGGGIAYLLNPIMKKLESKFKLKRVKSILIIYSIFVSLMVFGIIIITPELITNVKELLNDFVQKLPAYTEYINGWISKFTDLKSKNLELATYIEKNVIELSNYIAKNLDVSVKYIFDGLFGFTFGILKFFIGIIISIYLLKEKETIIRYTKSILLAAFKKRKTNFIIDIINRLNVAFSGFLYGKIIDSAILGILCFICLVILEVPFAMIISIIIGATHIIPYIGPLLGLVPTGIIVLITVPSDFILVMLCILLLIQIDGWIISPRIIGNKIGVSPLLVIVSLVIGGGLFGLFGMLIGVPIGVVIKDLLVEWIEKRVAKIEATNVEI